MSMIILSLSAPKCKRPELSALHQQHADQAWRLSQPSLMRIRAKAPHQAERISAILWTLIARNVPGYHPGHLTIREWARKQFQRALVEGVTSEDGPSLRKLRSA